MTAVPEAVPAELQGGHTTRERLGGSDNRIWDFGVDSIELFGK